MGFKNRPKIILFIFTTLLVTHVFAQVFIPFSFWKPTTAPYVLAYTVASGTAGNQAWGQTIVAGTALTFTNGWPGTQESGLAIFTASLSPAVSLPASGQFSIVVYGYNGSYNNGNGGGVNFSATNSGAGRITFVGSARYGGAGSYPTTIDGGGVSRYGAGTFYFQ